MVSTARRGAPWKVRGVRRRHGGYRGCSCSSAEREAESWLPKIKPVGLPPCTLMPNPSLKGNANGRPPGPGRRYAVHFRHPGPGGLPSAPP